MITERGLRPARHIHRCMLPLSPYLLLMLVALAACTSPQSADPTASPTHTQVPLATPAEPQATPTQSPAAPDPTATVESVEPDSRSPTREAPAAPGGDPEMTITIAEVPHDIPAYIRDEWRHWIDADDDCQNTRHEVLIAESRIPVTYKDDRQCQVIAGLWFDDFTGTEVTSASELDIDHLIALADAHRSGGWAWSSARKQEFANVLSDPGHLNAVVSSDNRQKSASGPDEWRPPNRSHWCDYATAWIRVKATWGLTATRDEAAALSEMIETCEIPPTLTLREADPSSRPVRKAPTPAPGSRTYGSCAEAERAGEQRERGSKGSARGFPKEMVPGARDGDNDGVVCER